MARNNFRKTRGSSKEYMLCEFCGDELKCTNCNTEEISKHIRKQLEVYYICKKCDTSFLCRCQSVKGLFI